MSLIYEKVNSSRSNLIHLVLLPGVSLRSPHSSPPCWQEPSRKPAPMTLPGITNDLWRAASGKHFGMVIYGRVREKGLQSRDIREWRNKTRRSGKISSFPISLISNADSLPTPLLLRGLNFGILYTCSPASNLALPWINLFHLSPHSWEFCRSRSLPKIIVFLNVQQQGNWFMYYEASGQWSIIQSLNMINLKPLLTTWKMSLK